MNRNFGTSLNDSLIGRNDNDCLVGGRGDDDLSGGNGNDLLWGGAGDDFLMAGSGNDTLVGGKGADSFLLSDLNAGVDTIADFSAEDKILICVNYFGSDLSQFSYNSDTGALLFDANGANLGGDVQIAQLASGLTLTSNNFELFYNG